MRFTSTLTRTASAGMRSAHEAIKRTKVRHRERHEQSQFRRFVTLMVALVVTVVVVTYGMFQTLAWIMA